MTDITRGTTRRRRSRVAVLLAAVGALLALAPGASGVGRYSDPTGDSGGAPDITGVTVASDASGHIMFTVNTASMPSDGLTLLLVDTDLNGATGAPDTVGADYIFLVDEAENAYGFARWTGSDLDFDTPSSTVRVSSRSTGVSISVNRSELGNTSGFNFWARTVKASTKHTDTAPEDGVFNYSLSAGGPEITSVLVATKPASGPKAGRPFVVTPAGLRLPASAATVLMPQPESYSCVARLAGRVLRGTGTGGCTWTLPRSARGKPLAVVITVTYQGATKSVRFVYRVS